MSRERSIKDLETIRYWHTTAFENNDEKIEKNYQNLIYTELLPRTNLLEIKNSLEMDDYSEKTMEELK